MRGGIDRRLVRGFNYLVWVFWIFFCVDGIVAVHAFGRGTGCRSCDCCRADGAAGGDTVTASPTPALCHRAVALRHNPPGTCFALGLCQTELEYEASCDVSSARPLRPLLLFFMTTKVLLITTWAQHFTEHLRPGSITTAICHFFYDNSRRSEHVMLR